MLLFVGLGNPGSEYVATRHNVGFMAVEEIAKRHRFNAFRRKFQGVSSEGTVGRERVLLLLPGTYMNDSGRAVREALNYLRLGSRQIVVFHDEIELPLGGLRVKVGGGNAGHNGLRSISEHIGNDYKRVRIGVGHPGHRDMVQHYVLHRFSREEMPWVQSMCELVASNVDLLVHEQDSSFQNKIHLGILDRGFSGTRRNE